MGVVDQTYGAGGALLSLLPLPLLLAALPNRSSCHSLIYLVTVRRRCDPLGRTGRKIRCEKPVQRVLRKKIDRTGRENRREIAITHQRTINPKRTNKDSAPGITPSMPAKCIKPTNQIEAESDNQVAVVRPAPSLAKPDPSVKCIMLGSGFARLAGAGRTSVLES